LSNEGLVSCRRDDGGKEFWSVSEAQAAPSAPAPEAKEPPPSRKKGKATAAGPDDRFDEFIIDPKAASPAPAPAPIQPDSVTVDSFEPSAPVIEPVKESHAAEGSFEPEPPKKNNRAKAEEAADADFEPVPEKEKPAKAPKKKAPDPEPFEAKPAKEGKPERKLSAGPDDHFDEFAERVPSKSGLPLTLMAVAGVIVLVVVLFIVGGGGGKTKKINDVKTELSGKLDSLAGKLDSLKEGTSNEIAKIREDNKALNDSINSLRAKLEKAVGGQVDKKAAEKEKPKPAQTRARGSR
jgi:hypothetical protein